MRKSRKKSKLSLTELAIEACKLEGKAETVDIANMREVIGVIWRYAAEHYTVAAWVESLKVMRDRMHSKKQTK